MNQSKSVPLTTFNVRFRAEFECDVHLFLAAISWDILEVVYFPEWITDGQGFRKTMPDLDVSMKLAGGLSIENLRWIADQISDCHVIADTIEPADKYDGKRKYDDFLSVVPVEHLAEIQAGLKGYNEYLDAQKTRCSNTIDTLDIFYDYAPMQPMPDGETGIPMVLNH